MEKTNITINNKECPHYKDESYSFTIIDDNVFIRNDDESEAVILSKEEIIRLFKITHPDIVCYKKLSNGDLFPY